MRLHDRKGPQRKLLEADEDDSSGIKSVLILRQEVCLKMKNKARLNEMKRNDVENGKTRKNTLLVLNDWESEKTESFSV